MKVMGALSTNEVWARIKQCLDTVEKVADTSGYLKDPLVRALRMAARTVQAAGEELARHPWTGSNVERLEKENADLRSQLSGLSVTVDALKEELCALRERTDPQPKPSAALLAPLAPRFSRESAEPTRGSVAAMTMESIRRRRRLWSQKRAPELRRLRWRGRFGGRRTRTSRSRVRCSTVAATGRGVYLRASSLS